MFMPGTDVSLHFVDQDVKLKGIVEGVHLSGFYGENYTVRIPLILRSSELLITFEANMPGLTITAV